MNAGKSFIVMKITLHFNYNCLFVFKILKKKTNIYHNLHINYIFFHRNFYFSSILCKGN